MTEVTVGRVMSDALYADPRSDRLIRTSDPLIVIGLQTNDDDYTCHRGISFDADCLQTCDPRGGGTALYSGYRMGARPHYQA